MKRNNSTFSLEWHRECLHNMEVSLQDERDALDRQRLRMHRLQDDVDLRKRQIAEAERRGLTEFDPDRLLVRRARATKGTPVTLEAEER